MNKLNSLICKKSYNKFNKFLCSEEEMYRILAILDLYTYYTNEINQFGILLPNDKSFFTNITYYQNKNNIIKSNLVDDTFFKFIDWQKLCEQPLDYVIPYYYALLKSSIIHCYKYAMCHYNKSSIDNIRTKLESLQATKINTYKNDYYKIMVQIKTNLTRTPWLMRSNSKLSDSSLSNISSNSSKSSKKSSISSKSKKSSKRSSISSKKTSKSSKDSGFSRRSKVSNRSITNSYISNKSINRPFVLLPECKLT